MAKFSIKALIPSLFSFIFLRTPAIPPAKALTNNPIVGAISLMIPPKYFTIGITSVLIIGPNVLITPKRASPATPATSVSILAISNIAGITSFLITSVIAPALLGEKKAVIALPNSANTGLIPLITAINIFMLAGLNTALNNGHNLVAI